MSDDLFHSTTSGGTTPSKSSSRKPSTPQYAAGGVGILPPQSVFNYRVEFFYNDDARDVLTKQITNIHTSVKDREIHVNFAEDLGGLVLNVLAEWHHVMPTIRIDLHTLDDNLNVLTTTSYEGVTVKDETRWYDYSAQGNNADINVTYEYMGDPDFTHHGLTIATAAANGTSVTAP